MQQSFQGLIVPAICGSGSRRPDSAWWVPRVEPAGDTEQAQVRRVSERTYFESHVRCPQAEVLCMWEESRWEKQDAQMQTEMGGWAVTLITLQLDVGSYWPLVLILPAMPSCKFSN